MKHKKYGHIAEFDLPAEYLKNYFVQFKEALMESGELCLDKDAFAELHALVEKEAAMLAEIDQEKNKEESR